MINNGIVTEYQIYAHLAKAGFDIKESAAYDHRNKLDFIITGHSRIDRIFNIGCQITTKIADAHKMKTFYDIQKTAQVVPKAVYIEIGPYVNIQAGAGELIHAALLNYAFNNTGGAESIIGLRLDVSGFRYFNIQERADKILRTGEDVLLLPGEETSNVGLSSGTAYATGSLGGSLSSVTKKALKTVTDDSASVGSRRYYGKLYSYVQDRGFGKILTESGSFEDNEIFFHLYNIEDKDLKNFLENYEDFQHGSCVDHEDIKVEFEIVMYKSREQAKIVGSHIPKNMANRQDAV